MTACSERSWRDVLVVGAGPAGLAVAAGLQDTGLDCLVVEQGPPPGERDAGNPAHLATGVGGAGLFSDGKFSFYPSATGLWSLCPGRDLRLAYDAMAKVLAPSGLAVPAYPRRLPDTSGPQPFRMKRYPSVYMTMEERTRLIMRLADSVGPGNLLTGTKAFRVGDGPGGSMTVGLQPVTTAADGDGTTVHCKALVLAGGRFGPLACDVRLKGVRYTFRRLEMGVRIDQPAEDFFLRDQRDLDPKFLWEDKSGRYSWRTFCCCRDGRVVATDFDGLVTLSGRADCPPTGRSNVGFNLRVLNEGEAALLCRETALLGVGMQPAPWMPLADFLAARGPFTHGTLRHRFGDRGAALLAEGLVRLTDRFGVRRLADAQVSGPTLEGVGHYPWTGPELMASGCPVWAVGDTAGRFRGITAALLSGFFAARRINEHFRRRA